MSTGQAAGPRERALAAAARAPRSPEEPPVELHSEGRVLILGEGERAKRAIERLHVPLECHWLSDEAAEPPRGVRLHRSDGRRVRVEGRLGAFQLRRGARDEKLGPGSTGEADAPVFDLVLDLGDEAALEAEWTPLGYHRPRQEAELELSLELLAASKGAIQKPKYFHLDPSACAHGRPGTEGCRRCLDACPAGAIDSVESRIVIDAALCQGGGTCATTCPTGAISHRRPPREDTHEALRRLVGTYREEAGGERPVLVLLGEDVGAEALASCPERAVPWTLHEVGSAGLETWLAALAFGAAAVRILRPPGLAPTIEAVVGEQISFGRAILEGLGHPSGALSFIEQGEDPLAGTELFEIPPAESLACRTKREALDSALAHLAAHAPGAPSVLPMPEGAPFGRLHVAHEACTVCFACVFVCPMRALSSGGGELLQLRFTEGACVQCGLCEAACPERAISREPRLLLGRSERRRQVLLHEDEPFACVRCGRGFASASTIRAVTERLVDHPMFAADGLEILRCCDDCRLRSL